MNYIYYKYFGRTKALAEACQNQWSHVGLCQRDSLLEMMQENRFLEENPKRLCCLHLPLGNPSHFTAITHWKHSSKTKELRKIQTLHINSRQSLKANSSSSWRQSGSEIMFSISSWDAIEVYVTFSIRGTFSLMQSFIFLNQDNCICRLCATRRNSSSGIKLSRSPNCASLWKGISGCQVPADQMNVQRFPKLGEVIWPLSPRATGVNPYWIGDMDCTTPRKAVPFRERQPHALHTNRKSLSQQLDCSGGRTPVSAMGNHQRVHSWSCTDIFLLLGNFSCSQHYVKLISLFAC